MANENIPGLKEDALNKLGPCAVCHKPLLDQEKGTLTFYRVKIDRCIWDASAVQRQVGLAMMLGGAIGPARVMGPDEDLAKVFCGPVEVAVHEGCASCIHHLMGLVSGNGSAEIANDEETVPA